MKILGLDVGEKRIGVARADSETRIAVPIGFIETNGLEWQEIARLASANNTLYFVLGLPRSNAGIETQQSLYVREFARVLTEKVPGAKIRFQDESFTSVEAEERLKARKASYQKGEIDAEAAAIILQDFLEYLGQESVSGEAQNTPPVTPELKKTPTVAEDNTKQRKPKMKKLLKWLIGLIICLILGALATGAVLYIKDRNAKERAAEYARQEAELQANSVFNFTIRPGETIFEVRENLIEVGYSAQEVDEALAADYDLPLLATRPTGASLEGFLYGETHEFYKTTPVKEIIETYLLGMAEVVDSHQLVEKYAAQDLTLYEGITLASIVQKEAPAEEQPTVAQVFLSRLAYGIPLGSDVTVSYALDVVDPERKTYLDNQAAVGVESCYNTRLYGGLPCGPISNPGLSALLAVAAPSDTSYLYFLTGDDGMMYYSYTEHEHIQNTYSHCQELCKVSL